MTVTAGNADAVILLYHGVTDSLSEGIENFSHKHQPAEVFRKQMAFISSHCSPMPLREMAERLADGCSLPLRPVSVTFDDTFLNNATVAKPILEETGVPATFFVATGFIGTNRRFWVDRLEHAINATRLTEIQSPVDGCRVPLTNAKERIAAVVAIKAEMKRMEPAQRDTILRILEETAQAEEKDVANYRNMSWDDVRSLDRPPFFEVGGHTVNHEILSYLSDEDLFSETAHCINDLADHLERRSGLFAYPEGQATHFDDRVIACLKKQGVKICPSAIDGINRPGVDPFHLRRIMVGFMGRSFPWTMGD